MNKITISPNPVIDNFELSLNITDYSVITILDISGRVLKITKLLPGEKKIQINSPDFNQGIYIIKVESNNKSYVTLSQKYKYKF